MQTLSSPTNQESVEGKQICILRCPDPTCGFIEFPACETHKVLYSKPMREEGTKKKLWSVCCLRCPASPGTGTHNVPPFNENCRRCSRTRAKPFLFFVRDFTAENLVSHMQAMKGQEMEAENATARTALLVCRKCKACEFPVAQDALMIWHSGRIQCTITNKTFIASDFFKFVHCREDCNGEVVALPVAVDKADAKLLAEKHPITPNLEVEKAAEEKVSVDFLLQTTSVGLRMAAMLDSKRLHDVSFVVGGDLVEEGEKPVVMKAHKSVLASRSPVFARMLYGAFAEGSETTQGPDGTVCIPLPSTSPVLIEILLRFLYSNHVELAVDNVMDVIQIADLYQVEALQIACRTFMNDNITVKTALGLFAATKHHGREYLERKGQDVISSPEFLNLDEESLSLLVSSDRLAVDEFELFDAVLRWGNKRCEERIREEKRAMANANNPPSSPSVIASDGGEKEKEKDKEQEKEKEKEKEKKGEEEEEKKAVKDDKEKEAEKEKTKDQEKDKEKEKDKDKASGKGKVTANPAMLREVLRKILPLIRFPLFSSANLSETDLLFHLLDVEQLRELYVWAGLQEMPSREKEALGLDERKYKPRSFNPNPRIGDAGLMCPYFSFDSSWGPQDVQILNDGKTVSFPGTCKQFLYRRGDQLWKAGMIYWEIKLDRVPGCYSAFGLCTPDFEPPGTLGQNAESWAVRIYPNSTDHQFSGLYHNSSHKPFHNQWMAGDVAGMLVDLSKTGKVIVFRNGQVIGEAFDNLKGKQVYPVVVLCHSTQMTVRKVRMVRVPKSGSGTIADGLAFEATET